MWRRLFERNGDRVAAGSNRPFVLTGDWAWLVVSGGVDVFCVEMVGAQAAGARMHLCRVEADHVLLGGPDDPDSDAALLAVGTSGTELLRVPKKALLELACGKADDENAGESGAGPIEAWVSGLYASAPPRDRPAHALELDSGQQVELPAGLVARPRRDVLWVRQVEGSSRLFGMPALRLGRGDVVPVSNRAWLHGHEAGRVLASGIGELPDPSTVSAALDRLATFALRLAADQLRQIKVAERQRLVRTAADRRTAYFGAWARLSEVMTRPRGTRPRLRKRASPGADTLLGAARLVGTSLGVEIRRPGAGSASVHARDPVAAIARASRIRVRPVALRGEWWREDGGPLLGWTASDARPVALLPEGTRAYVCHDPGACTQRRVTRKLASGLAPRAYTFYRGFGELRLTLPGVMRFGARRCRRDVLTFAVLSIAVSLLGLLAPIATGMVFNDIIPSADRPQLLQIATLLIVFAVAAALLSVGSWIALLRIEAKLGGDLIAAVWDRLLSLPAGFFRSYSAGNLATRAMAIESIRQILSGATMIALLTGSMSLFQFAFLFHINAKLALLSAALIVLSVIVTGVSSYIQLKDQRVITSLQAKLSGLTLQLLSNVSKLKVAGAETHAFALWARSFAEQRRLTFRVRMAGNVLRTFNTAFPVLANVVLFAAALPLAGPDGEIRTGDFIAFLGAFGTVASGMLAVSATFVGALAVIPYREQLAPILTEPPEVTRAQADPGLLRGDVEVEHVSFAYSAEGPAVFQDLTFQVRAGEFVALVGPSGTGKSTIFRLLLGFERPSGGAIYYDDQDLSNVDVEGVRSQIGTVLQHAQVMPGDILTNIVGSSHATLDEAWEAARMAGLAEDIKSMPMGMHTVIGEGQSTLSGGQRQRLIIARALAQRPRILLLDEATSALDNRTQSVVSGSLERLEVTRIVIAHRLSTIMHADRIYVIERGRVVESGTYAQLMRNDGPFAELAKRQLA